MKNFMRYLAGGVMLLALGLVLTFCDKDSQNEPKDSLNLSAPANTIGSQNQVFTGEIPKATVKRIDPATYRMKNGIEPSTLEPAEFTATLWDGGSVLEHKLAKMVSAPPKADVVFMFDLTGSMGGELNNAKLNSENIMDAIRLNILDTDFGVISHMDYPANYSSCGYSAPYGTSGTDYAYRLDNAVSADIDVVGGVIEGLDLGLGNDEPENYARALYETYADPSIGWRAGSKKIVVAWLDAIPHDCTLTIADPTISTGTDPGRNEIAEDGDDLDFDAVVDELAADNTLLIVLYSGASVAQFNFWSAQAVKTGGNAFQINENGTIPGDLDIAAFIAQKIADGVSMVNEVSLEVCTPGFESWLTDVNPPSYSDVQLPVGLPFDVTFTVPEGTPGGKYEFDVCLMGDGVPFAKQHVIITVVWKVPLDIHPMSCPNPLNRTGTGLMPAAILGFEGFDVTQIDVATLELAGQVPVKWSIEDVGAPYEPFWDKAIDKMSCNILGPDGYMDLALKFDNKTFGALFPGASKGDIIPVYIKGMMLDGTPLYGMDVLMIVK